MRYLLLILLLAACNATPERAADEQPQDAPEETVEPVEDETEAGDHARRKRPPVKKRAAPPTTANPSPDVPLLPPCKPEGTLQEQVLQRLDCVLETADGPPKTDK